MTWSSVKCIMDISYRQYDKQIKLYFPCVKLNKELNWIVLQLVVVVVLPCVKWNKELNWIVYLQLVGRVLGLVEPEAVLELGHEGLVRGDAGEWHLEEDQCDGRCNGTRAANYNGRWTVNTPLHMHVITSSKSCVALRQTSPKFYSRNWASRIRLKQALSAPSVWKTDIYIYID